MPANSEAVASLVAKNGSSLNKPGGANLPTTFQTNE